jgi:hypothetical protein
VIQEEEPRPGTRSTRKTGMCDFISLHVLSDFICKTGTQESEQDDISPLYRYTHVYKEFNHKNSQTLWLWSSRIPMLNIHRWLFFLAYVPTKATSPPVTPLDRKQSGVVTSYTPGAQLSLFRLSVGPWPWRSSRHEGSADILQRWQRHRAKRDRGSRVTAWLRTTEGCTPLVLPHPLLLSLIKDGPGHFSLQGNLPSLKNIKNCTFHYTGIKMAVFDVNILNFIFFLL